MAKILCITLALCAVATANPLGGLTDPFGGLTNGLVNGLSNELNNQLINTQLPGLGNFNKLGNFGSLAYGLTGTLAGTAEDAFGPLIDGAIPRNVNDIVGNERLSEAFETATNLVSNARHLASSLVNSAVGATIGVGIQANNQATRLAKDAKLLRDIMNVAEDAMSSVLDDTTAIESGVAGTATSAAGGLFNRVRVA